jgi:hypothetical protein
MSQQEPTPVRATGAVVTAKTHLDALATLMERWRDGEIGDRDMAALVDRSARQLARACFCETGQCCQVHQTHTSPHLGCVLR